MYDLAQDLALSVAERLDTRGFASVWYWILLALVWSFAVQWCLGVPPDLIARARRRRGDGSVEDLEDMARIGARRIVAQAAATGPAAIALAGFVATTVGLLGFVYWLEFAQALFLLCFPLVFVRLITLAAARTILSDAPESDALIGCLDRLRWRIYLLGAVSVALTVLFGTYINETRPILGG